MPVNNELWQEWRSYVEQTDPRDYLTYTQWLEARVVELQCQTN